MVEPIPLGELQGEEEWKSPLLKDDKGGPTSQGAFSPIHPKPLILFQIDNIFVLEQQPFKD